MVRMTKTPLTTSTLSPPSSGQPTPHPEGDSSSSAHVADLDNATPPPRHPSLGNFFRWFLAKGYLQGAVWAILITLSSSTNDVLIKFLGERLATPQIVFFRFLFSTLVLLPFMVPKGAKIFKTAYPGRHVARGLIGAVAFGLSAWGVVKLPLSMVATLSFTQPLFFLPMAYLFLRERLDRYRILATFAGFIGVAILISPTNGVFNAYVLIPIGATVMFAILDVYAKLMVAHDSKWTLMFYFGLSTTILSILPAMAVWQTPTPYEFLFLLLLGIGANLIQVCLYMAFSATDAVALSPFKYTELIFASFFGVLLFNTWPTWQTLLGALFIIASTMSITIHETGRQRLKKVPILRLFAR